MSNVALVDDVEGALTLSDVALDGVAVLAVGASETASSAHTVTQAEFNAVTLTNLATAGNSCAYRIWIHSVAIKAAYYVGANVVGYGEQAREGKGVRAEPQALSQSHLSCSECRSVSASRALGPRLSFVRLSILFCAVKLSMLAEAWTGTNCV